MVLFGSHWSYSFHIALVRLNLVQLSLFFPLLSHLVDFGIRSNLVYFGLLWFYSVHVSPYWSYLVSISPFCLLKSYSVHIGLIRSSRSNLVQFCQLGPLWCYSVRSFFWSSLVLSGPIWSILVLFGLLVLFSQLGPFYTLRSHSVQFGFI